MNITVRIPDDIVARLTEAGANPEDLARAALSKAADSLARDRQPTPRLTPAEAAARMRAARPGNTLPDGVSIRDLMIHGRA